MNEKVKIFRYVTEGTFDSYSWQLIEIKQRFISQIMTSKSPVRSCEDVDESVLSYAEVKALATGNPYIKEKMSLDIQVSKLKVLKASYISQHYRLEDNINQKYPRDIAFIREQIAGCQADIRVYEQHKGVFSMKIGTKIYTGTEKKEAGTALIEACRKIYRQDADACMDRCSPKVDPDVEIGQYMGFQMTARFDSFEEAYSVTLKGELHHTAYIGADSLGNIQRMNNVLDSMERRLEDMKLKLSVIEKQMELAREELAKPFEKEQELAEKLARLTELNVLLGSTEVKAENVNNRMEEVETDGAGRKSVLDKLRRFQSDTGTGNRCGGSDVRRENEQIEVRNA